MDEFEEEVLYCWHTVVGHTSVRRCEVGFDWPIRGGVGGLVFFFKELSENH